MDELIVRAMQAILARINLSTGFVHPTDRGCTIEMLRKLQQAGYVLDSAAICDWAVNNGLPIKYREDLRNIIDGVNARRRFRLKDAPYWRDNIVDILRMGEDNHD